MKSCTWTLSLYTDHTKDTLIFEREYKNVKEILEDFKFQKNFLYNCFKPQRINNTRKNRTNEKFKHIKIIKVCHKKTGDETLTFSI